MQFYIISEDSAFIKTIDILACQKSSSYLLSFCGYVRQRCREEIFQARALPDKALVASHGVEEWSLA
jgi:hypothetical protein